MKSWADLKLNRQFVRALEDLGFELPTSIQERSIPLILSGQKVIGIGQTGTGKTAAYLLPILQKLNFAQGVQPRALILAPTKELVIQIANQSKLLSKYSDLRTVELFGGIGTKVQIESLIRGADLIVATPGRFLEIYFLNEIATKLIKTLVIDEADRMMDMNFMPQLRKIFEVVPSKRQDLLFSATFPARVENMVKEFIDFPVRIEINPQATVPSQVSQLIYYTPNFKTKLNLLIHLLRNPELDRVMIFARTKQTVINLIKYFERSNIGSVKAIHSNKSQNSRINALEAFRNGEIRILISTDVSSRGIDVKEVSHVINFDVPSLYEDYVHRSGRTGRASATGSAITFVTPAHVHPIGKIEMLIGEKIPKANLPVEIFIEETPYEEAQLMAREIDRQKRNDDPSYKGAFHNRKA